MALLRQPHTSQPTQGTFSRLCESRYTLGGPKQAVFRRHPCVHRMLALQIGWPVSSGKGGVAADMVQDAGIV